MNTTMIRSKRLGFTLVEMLVVIGIIVVLAGLLLPVLMKGWSQAKSVTIRQNLAAIETALNAYKADFGAFPKTNLDNSIDTAAMPSPTMNGWDASINRSGLRGARTLCKALVGIGPRGSFSSAVYPGAAAHVLGQDGWGDPTEDSIPGSVAKAGFGFRVAGRGGEVNAMSRKYSPYLNMDAFRVAETYQFVNPQNGNITDFQFQLVTPYFPKDYLYDSLSGYTAPNPVSTGSITAGSWDCFVIIDSVGRPILYYPQLNPSADVHSDQDTTNNSANFITLEETVVATRVAMYRATDNNSGTTLALAPTFPGLHADTFKFYMGDVDKNGMINGSELPAKTPGYVLWSAGPNLKFNTAKAAPEMKGSDDINNLLPE